MRLVLDVDVALEGVGAAEDVDDHRVVDHEFRRRQRVDFVRIAAEAGHRLAHRGQVDDARHAGEVLHDHPGRGELDLGVRLRAGIPVGDGTDVLGGDVGAVLGAQQVLREHLEAVGQFRGAGNGVQPVDLVAVVPDGQRVAGGERIHRRIAHINSRLGKPGNADPLTGRSDTNGAVVPIVEGTPTRPCTPVWSCAARTATAAGADRYGKAP